MNNEEKREKERLKYLMSRFIELLSIQKKEKENPSPDHKGKMRVIRIELNRLNNEILFSTGDMSQKEYLEKKKKLFDIE